MTEERKYPLYVHIARALGALQRCRSDNANESQQAWEPRWESRIEHLAGELPHGSGFDTTPVIDTDDIKANRIVITGSYHNMDEYGGYAGWTDFRITVKPSLEHGFELRIVGGDEDFKDHVHYAYGDVLSAMYAESFLYEEI